MEIDPRISVYSEKRKRQREDALELANKVRTAQAELKRRLRQGRVDPVRLLEGNDDMWSQFAFDMKVGVLLRAIPGLSADMQGALLSEVAMLYHHRLRKVDQETRRQLAFLVALVLGRDA